MSNITIYHNPRCSKSRQTLQLLRDHNVEPTIIEYLKNPLSATEISTLLSQLNMTPKELMREGADESLSDAELIDAMVDNPKIIQRPIVVVNGKAALGRPPENVLAIL